MSRSFSALLSVLIGLAALAFARPPAQAPVDGDVFFYLGQVTTLQGIQNRAVDEGAALLRAPRLNDPEWQAAFFGHLAVWEAVYVAAVSIVPPAPLRDMHEATLDAYRFYNLAADEVRAGVETGDGDRFRAGSRYLTQGVDALDGAQVALAAFAEDAGVDVPAADTTPFVAPTPRAIVVAESTVTAEAGCDPRALSGCDDRR